MFTVELHKRALASFRILLGSTVLYDLIMRSQDLVAHYTDVGLMPRSTLILGYLHPEKFSFHIANGTALGQVVLFLAAAVLSLSLVLGFKTRAVTALLWLFTLSLQNRNPFIEHGSDAILRMMLFWSIFLPLGATLSFDEIRNKIDKPIVNLKLACSCFVIQILSIYWFSVAFKYGEIWFSKGTALFYMLNATQYTKPLGFVLLDIEQRLPGFLKVMTWCVLLIETLAPFTLILKNTILRWTGLVAIALLHFGIFITLDIGMFPWVDLVAMVPFLPLALSSPQPTDPRESGWQIWNLTLTAAALLGLAWNVGSSPLNTSNFKLAPVLESLSYSLRFDQYWYMFAPSPPQSGGWYVMVGHLADGRDVDLWNDNKPVSFERPELISSTYRNERWRLYLTTLNLPKWRSYARELAPYLCRYANELKGAPARVNSVEVFFMEQQTFVTPAEWGQHPPEKKKISDYVCASN